MSVEDIKLMAAYMTVHSENEDECKCIGHSLINKVVGSMNGMGDLPALSEDKRKEFFTLLNGQGSKDDENAFKRNIIYAAAIHSGRIEDTTKGATDFAADLPEDGEVTLKSKNYNFYKPQEAEVKVSKQKSSKGRKTRKGM